MTISKQTENVGATSKKDLPISKLDDLFKITYKDGKPEKIRLKNQVFLDVLKYLGFRRITITGGYFIVKVIDNIVEMVDTTSIIDDFEDFILNPPTGIEEGKTETSVVLEFFLANLQTRFAPNLLNRLRHKDELEFFTHTKNEAFFFFKNGMVRVSKDKLELLPYKALKGKSLWKSQILQRTFKPLAKDKFINSPFAFFTENISRGKNGDSEARFKALQTVIGYNLHSYFETKLKATIMTDSTMEETPNGRTGKTLLAKALGKVLNVNEVAHTYKEINGKNFRFDDKFRWQECMLNTVLVHLNDVAEKFKFEGLYNDITEGIKPEKKGRDPFLVKAKMIISTNRTILTEGGSSKDRCIEFELSDHYSPEHTPEDEFNHRFFRDWTDKQWHEFDNFMLYCVQQYLAHGLIEPSQINLNRRKLVEETNREFVLYMDEAIKRYEHGEGYEKKDVYGDFMKSDQNQFPFLKQRTFVKWCKTYMNYSPELESFSPEKNEKRANGESRIIFLKKINP